MKRNNNSRNIYVRGVVFKDILKAEDDTQFEDLKTMLILLVFERIDINYCQSQDDNIANTNTDFKVHPRIKRML